MTSSDFHGSLRAALSLPMALAQQRELHSRLLARVNPAETRRRVGPPRLGLLVALLLVATPAIVAAGVALRVTESPNGLVSANAFQAEIAAAEMAVPLPPNATWPPYLTATDSSGSYSAGGGRSWVEFVAYCAWDRAWLTAATTGNEGEAKVALRTLGAMTSWEFYTGSFASDSLRAHVDQVIAAVTAGNQGFVEAEVGLNCS